MPKSNYPGRFMAGLTVGNIPIDVSNPGEVFWVNNSTTGTHLAENGIAGANVGVGKGTYRKPFKTVDYAITRCKAGRGDVIYVMPNHVETISAADIIGIDVAGVSIIGLGQGESMARFDFTVATGTVAIDADNVSIEGIDFHANVTVVAKGLDIKDGADDFRISGCKFTCETLADDEFEDAIFITTSDRGVIENCYFDMDTGADADSAIHLSGVCLGCTIRNNYITGSYTIACIESVTVSQEQIVIDGNTLINGVHGGLNTVAVVSLLTGTTGFIQDNQCYTNVAGAVTGAIIADACFFGGGNWVSSAAETAPVAIEGGALSPIVQTAVNDSVLDGTDGTGLFTVTGNIFIHGFRLHAEVGASSSTTAGISLDATTAAFDTTFVTETDLAAASTAGDFAVALTAGAGWTIRQVEDTTENAQLWNTAVVCPPGQIEWLESGGTPGALISSITIYWSEATSGAAVAVV